MSRDLFAEGGSCLNVDANTMPANTVECNKMQNIWINVYATITSQGLMYLSPRDQITSAEDRIYIFIKSLPGY